MSASECFLTGFLYFIHSENVISKNWSAKTTKQPKYLRIINENNANNTNIGLTIGETIDIIAILRREIR